MAITVTYNTFSGLTGVNGLADYLNWFEAAYSDPGHASISAFSTADNNDVVVGDSTSLGFVNDYQFAGQAKDGNNDPIAAFIAHAGNVANVYNGDTDTTYTLNKLGYTLFDDPAHTLFGNLANLQFGNYYTTSSGLNTMNTVHLSVQGIGETTGYGLIKHGAVYDEINDYHNGNNHVHNVVYGLMGGLGGYAQADALEDAFDIYGITIIGTSGNEEFDGYAVSDTFVLNGGHDVINAGFQVGSGGDIINIAGLNNFANAAAAATAANTGSGVLLYRPSAFHAWNEVDVTGVTSGFTAANFIV